MKNVLAVVALVMVAGITMAQNEKVTLSPEQINAAVAKEDNQVRLTVQTA